MRIKRQLLESILSFYPPVPPEQGGIIGMRDGVVCEYVHDISSEELQHAIYTPNVSLLNEVIEKWAQKSVDFCGIVHSHPFEQNELSSGDLEYIRLVFKVNPEMEELYFPLILGNKLFVYRAEKDESEIKIVYEDITEVD